MTKMKKALVLAMSLILSMGAFAACSKDDDTSSSSSGVESSSETSSESGSESDSSVGETEVANYNVIFALATIPPVLAAMDCIDNGYETYAIIERGKTYSGIESIETFHNVGFDTANNLSTGFTNTEFNAMVDKVKELNDAEGDAYFNFYVQDGTALKGAAIAANAGLTEEQFHVYMCEDGTGAYTALNKTYVSGKTVTAEADEVYDGYAAAVATAQDEFNAIMAKTDNKNADTALRYNIGKAYALAALDNFTYYIQDEATVVGILENTGDVKTKLLSSFGVEGYDEAVDLTLNLKYQKISEGVSKLTEAERADYLTLMYGQYYQDTYDALTRTQRADKAAPAEKLVFIGSRHGGYPKFASNANYGIGGLASDATVPASYAELDAKYKTAMLFATETDYAAFLEVLNDPTNYGENVDEEAKAKAQVACFNVYIDYIYTLKFTYALYGEDYDLIMKGHPREAIGAWSEWGSRYKVNYGTDQTYVYDQLLDTALLNFHTKDSVGKYIGMVPYGTAAENLAYLGADIAICGLPSSTYNGYDTDVDVLFIMAETNQDIVGTGLETAASQVKERYEAGNLLYTDKNGEKQATVFFNTGNACKTLAKIYEELGDTANVTKYTDLFNGWLNSVYPNALDIDAQGFAVIEELKQ
ncbi:MAG: hypothetical protein IJV83_00135 [Clostridia bacterium]|nr:hypothetical protein [Clostridia bacterium]